MPLWYAENISLFQLDAPPKKNSRFALVIATKALRVSTLSILKLLLPLCWLERALADWNQKKISMGNKFLCLVLFM
jgi:hypothetical protein